MRDITTEFNALNKIKIALGSKNLLFYGNCIYALDNTSISNFRFSSINPLYGVVKDYTVLSISDINEINNEYKNTKKPIIYDSICNYIICDSIHISHTNIDSLGLFQLMERVSFVFNDIPNYSVDITNNEQLMGAIRSKATEPGEVCIIANTKYFMTLFYGLMKVNARDKLKMDIFDYTDNSFLTKFIVDKGGYSITHILRFIYK